MNKAQLREMISEMLGEENGDEERTPRDPEPTPEELKKMRAYVDMLGAEQAEKEADEAAWFSDDWKLEETQWGGFTGGAAPLDEPPMDSGPMSPEQQQRVFDILVDTGSDPEELKASGDFPDVIEENKMNIKQIIREELQAVLKEGFVSDTGDTPKMIAAVVRRWMADENIDSNDEQTIAEKIASIAVDSGVRDDDIPDWQNAVFDKLDAVMNEENGEPGMSMAAAKAKVFTQYSPQKFLEELADIDKKIMSLRSGNPFKSSGTKTPIYQIRLAINDITKAAELEMK